MNRLSDIASGSLGLTQLLPYPSRPSAYGIVPSWPNQSASNSTEYHGWAGGAATNLGE